MASILTQLEKRLSADFARYHLRTQALRLIGGFASTFALQLATGTGHLPAKALLATAFGVLITTARQLWPTLPWRLVTDHLHAAAEASVPQRTGMASNPPSIVPPASVGPPSGQAPQA